MVRGRVVVGLHVVGNTVDGEGGIFDPVCVPPGNISEVWMLLIEGVVGCVVPTSHDVARDAVLVVDDQIRDRCAIRNEGGLDMLTVDPVLAIFVR